MIVFFVASYALITPLWVDFSLGWSYFAIISLLFFSILFSVVKNAVPMLFYFSVMILYYGIAPVIQLFTGVDYLLVSSGYDGMAISAMAFIFVHVSGILLGYISVKPARGSVIGSQDFLDEGYSQFGVILCILVVVLGIYLLGVSEVLLPRNEQASSLMLSNFELFVLFIIKSVPVFITIYWLGSRGLGRKNWHLSPVFLLLFLFQAMVSNPVNTSRFVSMAGFLIVIVFIMIRAGRRSSIMWLFGLSPLAALVILPVTTLLRGGIGNVSLDYVLRSFRSLEFSAFTTLIDGMNIEHFPANNYTLSHLFIIIPRDLWASKANAIGAVVAENAGYVFTNVAITSFFEPYADYGYMGLIIASAFFGVLLRKADVFRYVASFKNRKFMYSLCLLATIPIIFRGDLGTAMIGLYAFVAAYEICRLLTANKFALV